MMETIMANEPFPLDRFHGDNPAGELVDLQGENETDQAPLYDERRTIKAWENFLTRGRQEPGITPVRGVIERSWLRSVQLGVDAHGRGSDVLADADNLYRLQRQNEDLLGSTADTFRRVAEVLRDAATMVVITDRNGIVLKVGGDQKTIDAGHDIRLELGAAWGENITGTNGIGTALITGQPVHVHAAEHFAEGIKDWTCVGAPIRSPIDGSIIGIIDFSGPQAIFYRHNVALAVIAANHIELALSEKISLERTRLLEAGIGRMAGTGSADGIVILDRFGRVVHHNDMASLRWRSIGRPVDLSVGARIVDIGEHLHQDNIDAMLPEELRGQSIEPLLVDGVIKGAMLVLAPKLRPSTVVSEGTFRRRAAVEAAKAEIIGCSPALVQAVERAERAAQGKTAILLEGETGVGKELFARLVAAASQESGKEPFVAFNCGAVSKELLGAELFGHAPGAFTGATREGRQGRFEAAHGGVLSLDEIGEMPLDLQPYLLRVLEERAVYRLGESKPRPVDVRLVASTNRNLKQEVAEGRFRKDLYFRIGVVKITIPPLRERIGDVEVLIDHFNREFSATYGRPPLRFEAAAQDLISHYDWPGNVRELRNLMENLVLMSINGTVGPGDFPEEFHEAMLARQEVPAAGDFNSGGGEDIARLDESERRIIERAIAAAGGHIAVAASKLGVSRSTLYRKLQLYRSQA
jgi:transcriptional regulator of acetoin/glycerol metabolism